MGIHGLVPITSLPVTIRGDCQGKKLPWAPIAGVPGGLVGYPRGCKINFAGSILTECTCS